MNFKKYIKVVFFLLASATLFSQQQAHYSLYMLQQSFINPSAIGSYDYVNGALLYKKQWVGIDKAPEIMAFDINSPLGKTNSALGLTVVNDKFAYSSTTSITANYSYRLKFSVKKYLSLGIGATANLFSAKLSSIQLRDANDPMLNGDISTTFTPNFKFGAYYFTDNFYLGLGMPNLAYSKFVNNGTYQASTAFDFNQTHFFIHSGWQKELNNKLKIQPSVLLKQISGAPMQVDVNLQFMLFNRIGLGASYRTMGTYIGLINIAMSDQLSIAYSYNYHTGVLSSYNSGSHEAMLCFKLINSSKKLISVDLPRF